MYLKATRTTRYYKRHWQSLLVLDNRFSTVYLTATRTTSCLEQGLRIDSMGRPLNGRNILGCSGAISLHLHFRVLSGLNRFKINETGFETGFQSKALKKSRPLRLKPVSDSCKLVLKLVYTVKYSEM